MTEENPQATVRPRTTLGGDPLPPQAEIDAWLAEMRADRQRWERKEARRRKLAVWLLIPYAASGGAAGSGIALVFGAGMARASALLIGGFTGLMLCQWIAPELLRRREDKDPS